MDGGLTKIRACIVLTAVLFAALLIVVFIGRQVPDENHTLAVLPNDMLPMDSIPRNTATINPSQHSKALSNEWRTAYPAPSYESRPKGFDQPQKKPLMVELNSADSLDLVQLYNIGPTFARRILKYRSRLGGFVDKRQLWEVWGMDSARYNDIAPHISVDTALVAKLDINSASIDQLKRHPYLDYYQAKAIVQYRETLGTYRSISDLKMVSLIDKSTYSKIASYLICSSQPSK